MGRINPKVRQALREGHLHAGNCSCESCYEKHEDVCPKHDEPRGECSVCPPCVRCDTLKLHMAQRKSK